MTSIVSLICLVILYTFQSVRNQYRDHDSSSQFAWKTQQIMTFISVIEMIIVILFEKIRYPWISAFIRPFYLIIQTRLLRDYVKRYLLVMKDSMPMVIFIIVVILYFSWGFQRFFSGTLEGV